MATIYKPVLNIQDKIIEIKYPIREGGHFYVLVFNLFSKIC